MVADGFRDEIFDNDRLTALVRALSYADAEIAGGRNVAKIFTSAIAQGVPRCFQQDIHAEIVTEGFRDKIFDTKILSVLVQALDDDSDTTRRMNVIKIFTSAIAQGVPDVYNGIFILK